MNCVFAHYVYGLSVELTEQEEATLAHLLDCPEAADTDEELALHELAVVERDIISDRLRKSHGIQSRYCRLCIVDNDAYKGSDAEAWDCFFGFGVLAFPLSDPLDVAAAEILRDKGAEWRSWVT